MTTKYASHVSAKNAAVTEPVIGKNLVENSTGGYAFALDDWKRLDRFILLGCEGGTYYATERKLTKENAAVVQRCANLDFRRTVDRIVEISEAGRAVKNDPAIFALAILATDSSNGVKDAVKLAVPKVCRTGTHLFQFVEAVDSLRGWGRSVRDMVGNWYNSKAVGSLAYQVAKYQSRNGWSHRDVLRKAHAKFDGTRNDVVRWAVKGWDSVGNDPHPDKDLVILWAFEKAKRAETVGEVVKLIVDYKLPRECVPTKFMNSPEVLAALLPSMGTTAMLRSLPVLTNAGLLNPFSEGQKFVCDTLGSLEKLKEGRIHPLSVLVALKTYAGGRSIRGSSMWTPVQKVVDTLDEAFYLSFRAVEPTGKRHLLALDISGSMGGGEVGGLPGLDPRTVSAAMALVTAAVEPQVYIVGYSHQLIDLPISPKMRLDDAVRVISGLPFGSTNCSLPVSAALGKKIPVDVFVNYTDNESNTGPHPFAVIQEYRQAMGIPAKMVSVGLTATQYSVADPADPLSMDIAGGDANLPTIISDFVRR